MTPLLYLLILAADPLPVPRFVGPPPTRPAPAARCECSAACVCGCQAGQPCRCRVLPGVCGGTSSLSAPAPPPPVFLPPAPASQWPATPAPLALPTVPTFAPPGGAGGILAPVRGLVPC